MSSSTKSGRSAFSIINDLKPNTASGRHSMKRLESVEEIVSKKQARNSIPLGRSHASVAAMNSHNSQGPPQVETQPSEFNLQLLKIREKEEEVKHAIETSEMLLRMQGGSTSTFQLKQVSTTSRIPGGTTDHTSYIGSHSNSVKQMPNILTGTFSSTPAMEINQPTETNEHSQEDLGASSQPRLPMDHQLVHL